MTKKEFFKRVAALYDFCNLQDGERSGRADWTKPEMAGDAGCAALDRMLRSMEECGAITAEECQWFYDGDYR